MADDDDSLEDVSPSNTPFPPNSVNDQDVFADSFEKMARKGCEETTFNTFCEDFGVENVDNKIVLDGNTLSTSVAKEDSSSPSSCEEDRSQKSNINGQDEKRLYELTDKDDHMKNTEHEKEQILPIDTKSSDQLSGVQITSHPVAKVELDFRSKENNAVEPNMVQNEGCDGAVEVKTVFSADGLEFRHRHLKASSESCDCETRSSNSIQLGTILEPDVDSKRTSESGVSSSDPEKINQSKNDGSATKTHAKSFSLFTFFMAEVTRGYHLEMEEDRYTEKRQKVYTFMRIPREFEKLMIFGFMLCLDCFLYVFTYLPLRVIVALYKLMTGILLWRARLLEPGQKCDLLKACILASCYVLLGYVDFAVMYHIVRGQSVIKLYVVYNMLDIADRLFSSFGQDILDALFWTATEPKDRRRDNIGILPHFVLAVIYVFLHSILVLFQATCLNVAVNSHSKALLVIMVSNQFVELKGSVFKRFEKNNLFQMSCSDIRERFHYLVLVSIVTLRNQTEFNWNRDNLYTILPYLIAVLSSEYFVDWLKHAFITKFNDIPVQVYSEYRLLLAQDATSSRQKNAHTDHFDLISRRMGFIPLPLGILVTKVVTQSFTISGTAGVCLVVSTYIFLCSLKVLNSIVFLGKACQYVNEKRDKDAAAAAAATAAKRSLHQPQTLTPQPSVTFLDSNNPSVQALASKEKLPGVSKSDSAVNKKRTKTLEEIDRYTLCSNQIVL